MTHGEFTSKAQQQQDPLDEKRIFADQELLLAGHSVICGCVSQVANKHFLKTTIVNLVKHYQKRAPQSLRAACRFHPSCSCFMILAVERHGAIRGLVKGIRRIFRCHQPNGGIDYP